MDQTYTFRKYKSQLLEYSKYFNNILNKPEKELETFLKVALLQRDLANKYYNKIVRPCH